MMSWITIGLTGLWPLVWKFGFTGIAIAACVAGYFFMPAPIAKLFPNIQRVLIWIAAGLTISLVSYAVGVADEHNRNVARDIRASEDAYAEARKAASDAPLQVDKQQRAADRRKSSRWLPAPKRDGYDRAGAR